MVEILVLTMIGIIFLGAGASESFLGTLVAFLLLVVYDWANGFHLVDWVWSNPNLFLLGVAGYVALGALWSLLKWRMWLGDEASSIQRRWNDYKKLRGRLENEVLNPEFKNDFMKDRMYGGRWSAAANKSRIVYWMSLWPGSVFWTFFHDILLKVWMKVYDLLSNVYDRIARSFIDRTLS